MCGICCLIPLNIESSSQTCLDVYFSNTNFYNFLSSRGPDCVSSVTAKINNDSHIMFIASVLSMRKGPTFRQPVTNETGDCLMYNGEIYGGLEVEKYDQINDCVVLFHELCRLEKEHEMLRFVSQLDGPFSFIFYEERTKTLHIARDPFGQRSLLLSLSPCHQFMQISSVACKDSSYTVDIPVGTLVTVDLDTLFAQFLHDKLINSEVVDTFWAAARQRSFSSLSELYVVPVNLGRDPLKFEALQSMDDDSLSSLQEEFESETTCFLDYLTKSLAKRLDCLKSKFESEQNCSSEAKIALLFSGGVDSLLLAVIVDQLWPSEWPVDLLNVSFSKDKFGAADYNSPDRLQALNALDHLKCLPNSTRRWNFVQINVNSEQLGSRRQDTIGHLLKPSTTVMDESIGCILWFAARGQGILLGNDGRNYSSPAKALFLGSGADELFGGYSRHRTKFNNFGWSGLAEELSNELQRISSRNLSRDDRVIADHGKESHLPYMDLSFVKHCNIELHLDSKCRLNLPRGIGEKFILRLTLAKLLGDNKGTIQLAFWPKKAMQFGTWFAKSENRKEKGSDISGKI